MRSLKSLNGYRADIDGLRAIAILSVIAFHVGAPGITGGFVGVDIFFVISGFLITGLLFSEAERAGRIHLIDFYARRVRKDPARVDTRRPRDLAARQCDPSTHRRAARTKPLGPFDRCLCLQRIFLADAPRLFRNRDPASATHMDLGGRRAVLFRVACSLDPRPRSSSPMSLQRENGHRRATCSGLPTVRCSLLVFYVLPAGGRILTSLHSVDGSSASALCLRSSTESLGTAWELG